jgi:hypothetical protein
MSHQHCTHENTKAARAKCRREHKPTVQPATVHPGALKDFAASYLGWDIDTLPLEADNVLELREAIAAADGFNPSFVAALEAQLTAHMMPGVADVIAEHDGHASRLQRELDEYDKNPGQMPKPVQPVTRETWRNYRGQPVKITAANYSPEGRSEYVGVIHSWGEKFFRYVAVGGTRSNMLATDRLISVVLADRD